MKLVIAVVQDKDSPKLSEALVAHQFHATKLASTGGFLRAGNTTFMIGVTDEKLNHLLEIIRENCKRRSQLVTPVTPHVGSLDHYVADPVRVSIGGATVFVLPIEHFEKI